MDLFFAACCSKNVYKWPPEGKYKPIHQSNQWKEVVYANESIWKFSTLLKMNTFRGDFTLWLLGPNLSLIAPPPLPPLDCVHTVFFGGGGSNRFGHQSGSCLHLLLGIKTQGKVAKCIAWLASLLYFGFWTFGFVSSICHECTANVLIKTGVHFC